MATYDDNLMDRLHVRFVDMKIDLDELVNSDKLSPQMQIELLRSAYMKSICSDCC